MTARSDFTHFHIRGRRFQGKSEKGEKRATVVTENKARSRQAVEKCFQRVEKKRSELYKKDRPETPQALN